MTNSDNNIQEQKEGRAEKAEDATGDDHTRKDVRRTLKDRRSKWRHPDYKGPEHRYHLRRTKKSRRTGEEEPEDELGKHIP